MADWNSIVQAIMSQISPQQSANPQQILQGIQNVPGASPLYPKPGYMTPADPGLTPGAAGTTPMPGAAPPVPAPGAVMPSPRNTMMPGGQTPLGWGGTANQINPTASNPQIQALIQSLMARR